MNKETATSLDERPHQLWAQPGKEPTWKTEGATKHVWEQTRHRMCSGRRETKEQGLVQTNYSNNMYQFKSYHKHYRCAVSDTWCVQRPSHSYSHKVQG